MKQIYRWATEAFEKRQSVAHGTLDKVYQMGHMDGYLDGFNAAKQGLLTLEHNPNRTWFEQPMEIMKSFGESEAEENPCGAV